MNKYYYKSPVGILEIIVKDDALISLRIVDKISNNSEETLFIQKIKLNLNEYFLGKRKKFDVNVTLKGTDFQQKVWQELLKIPYGKTISYSQIAQNIGNKNATRAVGNACNKNPIMIIIPCHRVIAKDGNLNGFAYGIEAKKFLLNLENI